MPGAASAGAANAGDAAPASDIERALADARAEGFAEGHRSGVAEAHAAIEHHAACALDALNANFAALGDDLRQREAEIAQQSAALAVIICRKFLPSRYRETAPDEITDLVATFLPRIAGMPKVTVRVAASLVAPLAERLSEVSRAAAFAGAVETASDTAVAEGDCRIEWSRGGVARDWASLWHEVDALLEETVGAVPRNLPSPPPSLSNPLKREARDA